jgi:DNA-directed RNA polymerase specialized sigma24 family protein
MTVDAVAAVAAAEVAVTFEDFYASRRPALVRLAVGLVDRPETAEDVVHDVFARAYEHPPVAWRHRL